MRNIIILIFFSFVLISFKSYTPSKNDEIKEYLVGNLKDFEFAKEEQNISKYNFINNLEQKISFSQFKGNVLLVNFWATWCPPCIKEMPSLDRLQLKLNKNFKVLAISEDRNGIKKVKDFFAENNINNLEQYFDVKGKLAKELELIGLPTTLVVDKKGYIIGRYQGDIEWDDTEVIKFINNFIEND